MQKTKYVRVNHFDNPFPKYLPINERSNKMSFIKIMFQGIAGFAIFWLVLWALTYTACVSSTHSSACKQDVTSQIIIKLINHGTRQ